MRRSVSAQIMPPIGVVPPEPGNAPAKGAVSPVVRRMLAYVGAVLLVVGGVGAFMSFHWMFFALLALGFVAIAAIMPFSLTALWGRNNP
jgi:hypothetical protein